MTRICRVCKQEKNLEEFTKHKKMKYGYDTICKICNRIHVMKWNKENPDRNKERSKEWYNENKEYAYKETRNRQALITETREKYKEGKNCVRCGYNKYSQVLQFHHRNKEDKKFTVGEATNLGVSIEHLKEEMDKCDLLCPNCHFELHYLINLKNKEKYKPIY